MCACRYRLLCVTHKILGFSTISESPNTEIDKGEGEIWEDIRCTMDIIHFCYGEVACHCLQGLLEFLPFNYTPVRIHAFLLIMHCMASFCMAP